jgi:hypothetical protein
MPNPPSQAATARVQRPMLNFRRVGCALALSTLNKATISYLPAAP